MLSVHWIDEFFIREIFLLAGDPARKRKNDVRKFRRRRCVVALGMNESPRSNRRRFRKPNGIRRATLAISFQGTSPEESLAGFV